MDMKTEKIYGRREMDNGRSSRFGVTDLGKRFALPSCFQKEG